jgi:hypothetical protein
VAGAERNLNYAGLIHEEEAESESASSGCDGASAGADGTTATSALSSSLSSGPQSHSEALLQLYCKVSGTCPIFYHIISSYFSEVPSTPKSPSRCSLVSPTICDLLRNCSVLYCIVLYCTVLYC